MASGVGGVGWGGFFGGSMTESEISITLVKPCLGGGLYYWVGEGWRRRGLGVGGGGLWSLRGLND